MKISRFQQKNIEENLFKGKVIVLYGARRTGKTTLVKDILLKYPEKKSRYFDMEDPDLQNRFKNSGIEKLKLLLKNLDFIVFDEAQKLENIGQTLKLLVDHFPEKQVIATGSSSFELSNKVNEPLTGRKFVYHLFPISCAELMLSGKDYFEITPLFPEMLRFGMYPNVIDSTEEDSFEFLKELTSSYLFRDIFTFQDVRNPEMLKKLLQLLAFQIGSEISYHEIAKRLRITEETVQRYIHLLEEAFIIFRLPAFARNHRREIVKSRKLFFWDLGIRNMLIKNTNTLDYRNDIGALWENFVIAERMKFLEYTRQEKNSYFWRTYDQKEIDLIEESGGKLQAYEIKWNTLKKVKPPKLFLETYENSEFKIINQENFLGFVS